MEGCSGVLQLFSDQQASGHHWNSTFVFASSVDTSNIHVFAAKLAISILLPGHFAGVNYLQ